MPDTPQPPHTDSSTGDPAHLVASSPSRIDSVALVKALFAIFALIGTIYGFHRYLDARIDARLNDRDVLERLAAEMRPSVLFNAEGSVLADLGAMRYLDEIHVKRAEPKSLLFVITIKPKAHLPIAPVLSVLGGYSGAATTRRGQGFDWVYEAHLIYLAEDPDGIRFRLDVLR